MANPINLRLYSNPCGEHLSLITTLHWLTEQPWDILTEKLSQYNFQDISFKEQFKRLLLIEMPNDESRVKMLVSLLVIILLPHFFISSIWFPDGAVRLLVKFKSLKCHSSGIPAFPSRRDKTRVKTLGMRHKGWRGHFSPTWTCQRLNFYIFWLTFRWFTGGLSPLAHSHLTGKKWNV